LNLSVDEFIRSAFFSESDYFMHMQKNAV